MKDIAVYTVIFGKYDQLRPVKVVGDADYICFTDEEMEAPKPWQIRVVDMPHSDIKFATRYYFDQSTVVLPEYEYTIMHSGNKILRVLPETLLGYLENTDIAGFKHPNRDSVYKEYQVIILNGYDAKENMLPQLHRYKKEGFIGKPLSACTLLIRRNTPAIQALEKLWWHEVSNGSYRDQLSFDYARWKLGVPITYIEGDVFRSPIMKRWRHIHARRRKKTL